VPEALSEDEDEIYRRLADLRGDEVAPRDRSFFEKLRSAFQ